MAESQYKKDHMLVQVRTLHHENLTSIANKYGITIRSLVDFILSAALSDAGNADEIGKILRDRQRSIDIATSMGKTKKLIEQERERAEARISKLEARLAELQAKSSERL